MSIEDLHKLLDERLPGYSTREIGDLEHPDRLLRGPRTQKTVLDSMLHAYGDPPTINIMSDKELAKENRRRGTDYGPWKYSNSDREYYNPRAFYIRNKGSDFLKGYKGPGEIYTSDYGGLIAELAHDKQFRDSKYKASKGGKGWSKGYTPFEEHDDSYEIEGSYEHEAHSGIEPKLWDLLTKVVSREKMVRGDTLPFWINPAQEYPRYYDDKSDNPHYKEMRLAIEPHADYPLIGDHYNHAKDGPRRLNPVHTSSINVNKAY